MQVVGVTMLIMVTAVIYVKSPLRADSQVSDAVSLTGVSAEALVEALSDEDFKTREDARMELWKMGEGALAAVERAAVSKNPEVAARAEGLLFYIRIGIAHDSSDEVIDLVLQYLEGNAANQYGILFKLSELGQWRQVLALYNRDEANVLNPQIVLLVDSLVAREARAAVLVKDYREAQEIIALAPDSLRSSMLRVWFHNNLSQKDAKGLSDELSEEFARLLKSDGVEGAQLRMAAQCLEGDLVGALENARLLGDEKIVPLLHALLGDAKPWLSMNIESERVSGDIKRLWKLQLLRLEGEDIAAHELAKEMLEDLEGNEGTHDERLIMSSLAANGYAQEALGILSRSYPFIASTYYKLSDDPQLSLAMLGIEKGTVAPYTEWIETVTEDALKDEAHYEKLLLLASFHHYHGEPEHVMAVMEPLMAALQKANSHDWYELIGALTEQFMAEQAIELIKGRIEDPEVVARSLECLLDRSGTQGELQNWQQVIWKLIKAKNDGALAVSIDEIAMLSGIIADPTGRTAEIEQELRDEVSKLPQDERVTLVEELYCFTTVRNDFIEAQQLASQMPANEPRWQQVVYFYDKAFGHWAKIEDSLAEEAKNNPGDMQRWTDWYICLRKLGKDAAAKDVYQQLLLVTMMEGQAINTVATKLHEAGYYKESTELREIMLLASPSLSVQSAQSILALVGQSEHFYQTGQWSKSSALKEMYLQIRMRGRIEAEDVASLLNTRFYADLGLGMSLYEEGHAEEAIAVFDKCRKFVSNGSLADDFFPALRKIDIGDNYAKWFEESYAKVAQVCKEYPNADNTHNTAAWLCSRALLRVDEGFTHAQAATKLRPSTGAYLDTMAEIWLARGDREKAIEWSIKATTSAVSHAQGKPRASGVAFTEYQMLKKQQDRFRNAPIPSGYKINR